MSDLIKKVEEVYPEVVELRRDFHENPEIGFEEVRTAKIVADYLRNLGLEVKEGVFKTGVTGLLKGDHPGKVFAIRADMDALPVEEDTGLPYASKIPGMMHACGHDGHTAMLLGTAKVLAGMKDRLHGSVKFIFQPAEEQAPAGGGAKPMVEAGALENPKVDAIMAMHLYPDVPTGVVRLAFPEASTAADIAEVEVFGKGGHASKPEESVDALLAACQMVNQFQSIVSRNIDPQDMAVISICKMQSGTASNIISDHAYLLGSPRTLTEKARQTVKTRMEEVVEGVAKATGTTAKFTWNYGYSAVHNDKVLRDMLDDVVVKALGEERLDRVTRPITGAEDFSAFIDSGVPGVMAILGAGIPGAPLYMNHHPKFDWDEEAMKTGMQVFAEMTMEYLKD